MKHITRLVLFLLCAGILTACASEQKEDPRYNRKIYLTEEDYLDDLNEEASKERREAPPVIESEYIFNATPETDKNVYFYDERQQPKIPGQPADSDYKKEKRLWQRPKRFAPDQYYGAQGAPSPATDNSGEMNYDY